MDKNAIFGDPVDHSLPTLHFSASSWTGTAKSSLALCLRESSYSGWYDLTVAILGDREAEVA